MLKLKDEIKQSRQIILFGAGDIGYAALCMLEREGMGDRVLYFCDNAADKQGKTYYEKKIYSYDAIKEDSMDAVFIITNKYHSIAIKNQILDYNERQKVYHYLDIYESSDSVQFEREFCAVFHIDGMDNYFDEAESKDKMDIFWAEDSLFYSLFSKLDLKCVVELACGRGRHVHKYAENASQIILVDILEKNISICRSRLGQYPSINYIVNNGHDLSAIDDRSCTAVFCYDAMVHFESIDVYQYLLETKRILCEGGMGLFHHSNNGSDYKANFANAVGGRSYMTMDLFAHFADRAGLQIVEQKEIRWSENIVDGLTLVRKG